MIVAQKDIYTVVKDGSKYRVKRGRKIIGTFKLKMDAVKYMEFKERWESSND